MKKVLTLCIAREENRILLGMKKRGFGVGRWNGFGGKLIEGESIEDGAIREVKEEALIEIIDFEKVGILDFEFENNPNVLEVHLYLIKSFSREPKETEEMKPEWFKINEMPYDQMWSSDTCWMPLFLAGKKFRGYFMFDRPSDEDYNAKILKQELKEVDNLD